MAQRLKKRGFPITTATEGATALQRLEEGAIDIAFVIDEYGEFQGIVTLHDLLEAVTGEFRQVNP